MQADWHSLGEVSYRKWHVYDMQWLQNETGFQLDNSIVCGAQFGGPLAIVRDNRKAIPSNGPAPGSDKLRIFTSAGAKLAEVGWDASKKIVGMGWSDLENLTIVLDDGNVLSYDIHGKLVKNFLLMDAASTAHVIECHFWGNGVVAIASDMGIYVAEGLASSDSISGIRKYKLATGLTTEKPYTAMAIIPPLQSRSGMLEVMLGTSDCSVLVIDENETEDQMLQDRIDSPITKMSVAPNGRFLACYRKDGLLTVMSSTFTTKVLDFDTKSLSKPMDIAWCGEDAVVLLWRNTGIVMVGPYGDWLNFPYEGTVHLVAEPDCCRIVSTTDCEMLQRVPASTEAITRIGSTDPAALMFDAMEAFEEGDPKSDENIRSIAATNQLADAVQACISAASAEFSITRQQALMKAASYGKAFCPDADSVEFVEVARKLRVLNEVRKPNIALPLTIQQYNRLTPEVLVNRLTIRNHHFLALKICELLKLKNERVLVHWASEKVKRMAATTSTDEEISLIIRKHLEPYGRVSYLEVATAAYHMGRRRLATMILDMEQHAADQVPLLLSMKEEELALQKAINSEDTDLIYLTLIHLERSRPDMETFFRLVHAHPEALALWKVFYRNKVTVGDRGLLHNLLMYSKNYLDAGIAAVGQAYIQPSMDARQVYLRDASHLFSHGRGDLPFMKSVTDEHIALLELQKALDIKNSSTGLTFTGLTLREMVQKMVLLSVAENSQAAEWDREVQRVSKNFKMSEKALYHIKISAYCQAGAWNSLSRLAAEKKSPVGYKPFAIACIKYGRPASEIEKYIDRCTVLEEKFDLYMLLEQWKKAADVAIKLKDQNRLIDAGRNSRNPQIEAYVQDALNKM